MARRISNSEKAESINPIAQLEAAKAAYEAAKQAAKAARQAAREAKAEAVKAAKAARPEGEIAQLASVIKAVCSRPEGATKKEILAAYLSKLGVAEDSDAAIKKAATLSAQLGARIAPRLATLGVKLEIRRAMGEKAAHYIAMPIEKQD